MVELAPLRPDSPALILRKVTVWSFTHLDKEMKMRSRNENSGDYVQKKDKAEMNCRHREQFWPVLKQSVRRYIRSVRIRCLCGPTLINAEQEEICRLCDRHLHIHLDTFSTSYFFFTLDITDMRQTKTPIWSIFGETCRWTLAYHVSEFNGGGRTVGFGVGWICVQHHLYLCIKVINTHHRLAVREHRGAKVSLATPSAHPKNTLYSSNYNLY